LDLPLIWLVGLLLRDLLVKYLGVDFPTARSLVAGVEVDWGVSSVTEQVLGHAAIILCSVEQGLPDPVDGVLI